MDRLLGTTWQALPLMTEAEQEEVTCGLEQMCEWFKGPFGGWTHDLYLGRCRMPELSPETIKAVLLAWLSPEADGGMVCRGCGLEYPRHRSPPMNQWRVLPGKIPLQGPPPWYDLPEFFQACPNCGTSRFEIDWPHLVPDTERPWMNLDGFMGKVD